MNINFTRRNKDFAIYLPAISSFFASFIGEQQNNSEYVPLSRMPTKIPEMEMLNPFNQNKGIFHYRYAVYSAGHAKLNLDKYIPKELMFRNRPKHTFVLGDSGGFQIAKGVWNEEWNNPNNKDAEKKRATVLRWLCELTDYSMILDIPTGTYRNPESADATGIRSYDDAVSATKYNNDYFIRNRFGNTKFLNVLQGSNHVEAEDWYGHMKKYCDPKKYRNHFNGWAFGGCNMADPHIALKRLVTLIHEGYLTEGIHDWIHFLGTAKLEWALLLTDIQRAIRRIHNPNLTISFDGANPFICTAKGQIYTQIKLTPMAKWAFSVETTVNNKNYTKDARSFRDTCIQDGIHNIFVDSPISERILTNDICVYAPGNKDKQGKENKTSWDSFSYMLLMSHNLYHHINAVQEANRLYDKNIIPLQLYDSISGKCARDIINEIFDEPDYEKRLKIIDSYSNFWTKIPSSHGMGGKQSYSAQKTFDSIIDNAGDFNQIIKSKSSKKPLKPNVINIFSEDN